MWDGAHHTCDTEETELYHKDKSLDLSSGSAEEKGAHENKGKQSHFKINEDKNDKELLDLQSDAKREINDHSLRDSYLLAKGALLSDRYEIEDTLGWGGFGITYRARDRKLELEVAIKEYFPSNLVSRMPWCTQVEVNSDKMLPEYEKGLTRFLEEAQNMAQFSEEKHIVHVYNYFQENGTAYLVMEYLVGCTLKEYTQERGGKLPYEQAIPIMRDILSALKPLHKKKIIHRDISPDNIFICLDGTVKLIDFGAARFTDDGDLQRTRSVILKPGYAPPEQYRSKGKQGSWTDLYALGATIYRTVTGVVPDESVNREVQDKLAMPRQIIPEIPDYLNSILMKCMALQIPLRFQRVDEVEKKLREKKCVAAVKTTLFRRKLARTLLIVGSLAGIAVAVAGEYLYIDRKQKQASLEPCEISVLVTSDEEAVSEKKKILDDAISEFKQTYPFVQVNVQVVAESEYEEILQTRAEIGEFPTVFESGGLGERCDGILAPLTYTQELLSEEDMLFAEHIFAEQKDVRKLPTSFDCIVCYKNTVMLQENNPKFAAHNDLELFLQEKSSVYFGTMKDYTRIQKELAGRYEVQPLNPDEQIIAFSDTWSVSALADDAQRNAGERLLYYLLGDQAQDVLYIQNDGGIPLRQSERETFSTVNPELSELVQSATGADGFGEISPQLCEALYQEAQQNK